MEFELRAFVNLTDLCLDILFSRTFLSISMFYHNGPMRNVRKWCALFNITFLSTIWYGTICMTSLFRRNELYVKLFDTDKMGSCDDYFYNKAYYEREVLLISWIKTLITLDVVQILQHIKTLASSTIKWQHTFWSTLVQVIACCSTTPSHYLKQCWYFS